MEFKQRINWVFISLFMIVSYGIKGQAVGINTSTPDASAVLDVTSTTGGVLVPRMSSADRYAIAAPADGLLVFDTDEACFAVYKSSSWFLICGVQETMNLSIISGNAQAACLGEALPNPVVVELLGGGGAPIAGETLTFTITSGGGSLSVGTAVTDALGRAQFNWTLGVAGAQTVDVSGTSMTTQVATAALGTPVVGGQITDTRDGAIYAVTTVGGQVWMAENLRYDVPGVHTAGSVIDTINPSNPSGSYGRIYDWNTQMNGQAASNASPSGVQGICPCGWHVPSDEEWKTLEMTLGMTRLEADRVQAYRGTNEGAMLKSTGAWSSSGAGTNSSNMSIEPAGYYLSGGFANLFNYAYFWTASENSSNTANGIGRLMRNTSTQIFRGNTISKVRGYSLRCVQD